ncbi:MAG: tetratricopeptide repeat protein [Patescibacteria group bacterium]
MLKTIEKLEKIIIVASVFLIPIFFLSSFVNIYIPAKSALLVTSVLLLFSLKLFKIIIKGSIDFSTATFDIPVFLLATAYIASTLIQSPNRTDAFFLPGSATIVIAGALFYFIVNQQRNKDTIKLGLIASAVGVSFVGLLAYTGIFGKISLLPTFMKTENFSLVGGNIAQIVFLLPALVLAVVKVIHDESLAEKITYSIFSIFIGFGLLVSVYSIIPKKGEVLQIPGITTTWSIAIDSFKENPLFGVGVDNYKSAFNKYKPIEYNKTKLWNVRFNSANNFYLTAWTETGLLGLIALMATIIVVIKNAPDKADGLLSRDSFLALISLLLVGLFLPFNLVSLFLLFLLLSLSSKTSKIHLPIISDSAYSLNKGYSYKIPVYIVTIPLLIIIAYALFVQAKFLSAESFLASAVAAETKKDGGAETRSLLSKAIDQNPNTDTYFNYAAKTDLAIANLIAKKDPKDITDREKQAIAQYIQESITLAKQATALNPQKSENWEFLATMYKSVMPYVKDADNYALQAYRQAINLDPLNPNLRIAQGGIYYSSGDYENAIDAFKLAVATKPDHANAHYNLAIAYRENQQIDKAIITLKTVLTLVEKDSNDYKLAEKELQNLESRKTTQVETPTGSELTPPATPEPTLNPQIELPPADVTEPQVSPTPNQ